MQAENEYPEDAEVERRLDEVLQMILCPVAGCWPEHGAESAYYFDEDTGSHGLEVWPVALENSEESSGNGDSPDDDLFFELAEFDFLRLVKEVPLEKLHFSQGEAVFEIGWKEAGRNLELRVHIQPAEADDEE